MFSLFVATIIGVAVLSWPALSTGGGMDFGGRQLAQAYRSR